ncbi:hypothetical protein [Terricaulis sp.]|uniref:hypothetical protein n=1 Tax=Terricaulis sp. TaxID=2768686 RepID=UPI0037836096
MLRGAEAGDRKAQPGAMIGLLSLIVGVVWIGGALATAVALLGPRLQTLSVAEMGALAGGVLLPALMVWFSGAAAREGARARAEAQRLADAADRLLNPEQSATGAARELAMTVRGEITALDRALEQTLERLGEVQGKIAQQAATVENMSDQAKAGANTMITGMEREREELLRISRDLTQQASTIGDHISKHTTSISQAARQAEAEVRAADQALDHRLTSFGAAAALITDRTQALSGAAQASADSALRLETALSNALDVLAKATSLTDAARQSADAATLAANSTAGAVRESTSRAIDDAKRAADLIRGEAVNVEREAAVALERLRDAADAAREAAIGARAAVEEDERAARQRTRSAPPQQSYDADWRRERDPLEDAPPPPRARREEPPRRADSSGERAPERPLPGGEWTWRDLLSNVEDGGAQSSRRQPADDAVARLQHQISEPRGGYPPSLAIAETISQTGMRLDEVFSASGLERIAQRARGGTQARRRAVRDAAPDAVHRLSDHLARNPQANQEAMAFLRSEGAKIAELLARGRAAMNADATRAFLLIDSAAG